jgi:hypothetical protein
MPIRSVVITLAALGLLSACGAEEGNGFIVSEDRQVSSFSKVKVADGVSVEIVLGDRRVTVTTDDNLRDAFKIDVEGDTLKIDREGGNIEPTVARIVISTPVLKGLEATDRAQVSAQATQSEEWRLTVKDRSNVVITGVTSTRFYVDARDESRVEAFGLTRDINIDCHDNSVVNADGVSAGRAKLDVSGGSLVNVNATNEIEIDASGNSRIIVSGDAPSRNIDADERSEIVFLNQ